MSRLPPLAFAAGALLALSAQAALERTGYYITQFGIANGHIVEWNTGSGLARLTDDKGVANATFTQEAASVRTLVLDVPYTVESETVDPCGGPAIARAVTTGYGYATVGAPREMDNTRIGTHGYTYWVTGCTAGTREDWAGEVYAYSGRPLRMRLPLTDVGPGSRLSGFSEAAVVRDGAGQLLPLFPAQDTVVFTGLPGMATFERTGHSYPVRLDDDGWLVFSLPGGERAYTRMSLGTPRGNQHWLYADLAGGQAQWMRQTHIVTPQPGAVFASLRQAARYWLSPIQSATPPYNYSGWQLEPDLTGFSCFGPAIDAAYCVTPLLSWAYAGDVTIQRPWGPSQRRVRHWQALARHGDTQWVMEREDIVNLDGSHAGVFIDPRVIGYTDMGSAGAATMRAAPKATTAVPPRAALSAAP